ncbi:PREDICTED: uncharacterized protein LOC108565831 [Nicrophorus vespilloides]|uniref:Uncharacterized protein LOC108565831 n=1 Tax=Nicrophorus vespilloides TaxID=110193 RepID=A0ABM1N2B6_NICVS|nr:PREDICTED: uncharacterized protein LOC108565831 [Nicrophorus vespilloides]
MLLILCGAFLLVTIASAETITSVPPYVKQCHEGDAQIINCFIGALHHLQPYLAEGISEIELPPVEPFRMDELSLSLTSGPNGYKVTLSDIDVFGASNYTVTKMKLSENGKPFEAKIKMPELRLTSKYKSSGVLLIIPASGNGTFNGKFQDVTAVVKGTVGFKTKDNQRYMHVDTLMVDIDIKHVRMAVKDVYRNNRIIGEAMNLFLRENGQEVVKAMLPQLRRKLSNLFQSISNQLLTHLPVDIFYVPKVA